MKSSMKITLWGTPSCFAFPYFQRLIRFGLCSGRILGRMGAILEPIPSFKRQPTWFLLCIWSLRLTKFVILRLLSGARKSWDSTISQSLIYVLRIILVGHKHFSQMPLSGMFEKDLEIKDKMTSS